MIRNLRRKFVLITMLLVSVVLLAVFAGICLYYAGTLRNESYRALEIALDRPFDNRFPNFQLGGNVPEGFSREPMFAVSVMPDGIATLIFSDRIDVSDEEIIEVTELALNSGEERGELDSHNLRFLVRTREHETKVAFVLLSFEKGELRHVAFITGLGVVGAFLVFLMASVLLAHWALKPVEHSWQQQRQFVADASHELKTPLTVILANLNILRSNQNDSVKAQLHWIDNTEQEARRMKGLVDDMLYLARGDDARGQTPMLALNLSDIASTTALSFESVAFEHGLTLDIDAEPGIEVVGDEPQLKQLVGILLDNAVKYAETGSEIRLCLKNCQSQAELSVYNQGRPIPPEDQKHLFERFYRVDTSRSEAGYGLGLSIAKTITDTHKGRLGVHSDEQGTVFTVRLPALP